ncbi:MAG: pyridoxamine kinase [Lachnospiraceae bacterium]|nr:pyridoxamine kinase [Lachnospiraceae bacterium]
MYKKVLTIQDISCVGQCSLTVALPILSASGMETVILPSAILSTHTAGFTGFTFRDLTDDIDGIADHWAKENIFFDTLYTGYLGSIAQIDKVIRFADTRLNEGAPLIVDPAMADNGVLYSIFDDEFVKNMKRLTDKADIILPNITEACFLTGTEYKETYDEAYILTLVKKLAADDEQTVVLTGVSYGKETTGVVVYKNGKLDYYEHEKIEKGCHGTGDVYASAFVGAYMNGKTAFESAKIAADYTVSCIKYTQGDETHWYGVKFEPVLGEYINLLKK